MRKLALIGDVARVAGHVASDRLRRPQPTALPEIPPSPTSLTVEWLTSALCRDCPGAHVTRFYLGPPNEGTTSRRAVIVEYDEAGREAGLTTRIFAKFSATLVSRLVTGLSGAAAAEAGFYADARPLLDIECPDGYYAACDPVSCRSTLLIEDVVATRGVDWVDARTTHVDRAMAERMIDNMARYHGQMWMNAGLERWSWLPGAEAFQLRVNDAIDFEKRSMVGVERSEGVVSPEFAARRGEIYPCLMRSLALHAGKPHTLLHQDTHPQNWYVTPGGDMGLFDWNAAAQGCWALDVAYALAAGLVVEDRRAWERDLLARYLERLAEAGGTAPDFNEAWLDYRQQVFHGLIFWLYVQGAGRMQPEIAPRELREIMVGRLAQAVVDLDAFKTLG